MLPGIYFAEKLAWQSGIEWCAALVNLGLNYLWIPKYGMVGAALATLVSYIVLSVLAWYTGKKYLHLLIDWRKLSLVIVVYTFGAMILNLLSLGVMDFGYFFVYSLSTLGGVFFVIYYIVLRREERKVLRKYYKRYVG
jgi:O-antigen/teichoic acid export membrane protein